MQACGSCTCGENTDQPEATATTPPLGIAAFEELSVIDLPIVYSMKNGEETIREDRLPLFLLLSHY